MAFFLSVANRALFKEASHATAIFYVRRRLAWHWSLVQRLLIGIALIHDAIVHVEQIDKVAIVVCSLVGALAGILLIIGLLTPFLRGLAAFTEVWSVFWGNGHLLIAIVLAALATGLAMLCPGAWSVDGCLFAGST